MWARQDGGVDQPMNSCALANACVPEIDACAGLVCGTVINDCGDEQLYATQLVGIREEAGASGSEIRFNNTATLCTRRGHEKDPSLISQGKGSTVSDNWTETIIPSNDSVEVIEYLREKMKL